MDNRNPHRGSSFEDFLVDEGIADDVYAAALRRAVAEQALDEKKSAKAVGKTVEINFKNI